MRQTVLLLLAGFIVSLSGPVDPARAGGGGFGFKSGHHGVGAHQSRVGRGVLSQIPNRMHSIMRQNRQDFISRVNKHRPSTGVPQRFSKSPEKTQEKKFDRRTGFGKPRHQFGLKRNKHRRFGPNRFARQGTFIPGFGVQQFVPIPLGGPFHPFGFPPGFGVFRPGFLPFSTGITTGSTGRSDFQQRMFEKTGIAFKNAPHRTGQAFSGMQGNSHQRVTPKPQHSHRELKRMKDGKLVFSDYGGRVVRDKKIGPEDRR